MPLRPSVNGLFCFFGVFLPFSLDTVGKPGIIYTGNGFYVILFTVL